jgi:hypothetical protein
MKKDLTMKELEFIRVYTDSGSDTFGNATQSYIKAGYKAKNNAVARNGGSELLAKPYIREKMEDLMEKGELDFLSHLNTLDRKLKKLAEEGTISREELMAIRLGLEAQGKLGKGQGTQTAIQINMGEHGYSLKQMGILDLMKLEKDVKEELQLKLNTPMSTGQTFLEKLRAEVPIDTEAQQTVVSLPENKTEQVSTDTQTILPIKSKDDSLPPTEVNTHVEGAD